MNSLDVLLENISSSDNYFENFIKNMEDIGWGLVYGETDCLDFIASESYKTDEAYRDENTLDIIITLNLPESGNKGLALMAGYNTGGQLIPFGYSEKIEYEPQTRLRDQIKETLTDKGLPAEHKKLLDSHKDTLSLLLDKVDEAQNFIETQGNNQSA